MKLFKGTCVSKDVDLMPGGSYNLNVMTTEETAMSSAQESYSQHGEDRVLAGIFGNKIGTAVEVGAYDGVTLSNTYYFEKQGWTTILVEPLPYLVEKIKKSRKALVYQCAASSAPGTATFNIVTGGEHLELISTLEDSLDFRKAVENRHGKIEKIAVPVRTLDSILEDANVHEIDFITIDVEGHELNALQGLTLSKWKPRIVILEDNFLGADPTVTEYMARNGYVCFKMTHCNMWYAKKDDRELAKVRFVLFQQLRMFKSRIHSNSKRAIKKILPEAAVNSIKRVLRG
jgi:FkbM family methyltransferase